MQKIIRSQFKHHAIIMIAHRLSSLQDFDQVIVLDAGRAVEFGRPAEVGERIPAVAFLSCIMLQFQCRCEN